MTGPEHYREAQRLAKAARATAQDGQALDHPNGQPILDAEAAAYAALAQVHATLALAAGMALHAVGNYPMNAPYATAWSDATGLKPPTGATP